jgi:magnesium transporter
MLARKKYGNLSWIDLESPTHREVQDVANEFGLAPLIAEELLMPSTKPRVEFFDTHVYVILHFPALRQSHTSPEQEVDFVIGHDFLITTHYDIVDPLHKFAKVFEVSSILEKGQLGEHAGFLFFYMLKKLYRGLENEIDHVQRDLLHIEENIFAGHEVEMVKAISRAARDLLNMRQTIEPHREVLRTLETEGARFFGDSFSPYLRALANEYYRVHNHIMRNTDSIHELRETNNSLLSTKENETMRTLTLMALLTFPLALFVAIFDIDAEYNPIIGLPYDFWIIVGAVATVGLGMVLYFKHKHWL